MKPFEILRKQMCVRLFACAIVLALTSITTNAQTHDHESNAPIPEKVTFNAHIRPIMSKTCFVCHGPDVKNNQSAFLLTSFETATGVLPSDDDLVGIKPGKPEQSEVYLRITGQSETGDQMPPADFHHQLSDRDKQLFRRWIEQGAQYEQHWSYKPIVRPSVPTLPESKTANPIDAFVAERLAQDDLKPSPSADRATLLRRLSLDLIGLPPTPMQLQAFLDDDSDDDSNRAYESAVDRLLASPQYGERMAGFWLDLVRFADTVGFHGDQNQRIFPYRDYVINAFNDNMPFDQFTREQLAGDLLPQPTDQQLVATGFLRLNMMTREGGAQPGEYLAKYRADRVRALGTAWLGSTLGCCECHNHKYDPFSARDFYSFGAFFDDLRQWGVYTSYQYTPNSDLKGFNNNYPFPPEMRVNSESLRAEMSVQEQLRDRQLLKELGEVILADGNFNKWCQELLGQLKQSPSGWIPLEVESVTASLGSKHEVVADGSIVLTGKPKYGESEKPKEEGKPKPKTKELIRVATCVSSKTIVNSIRVEVLAHESHGGFVGRAKEGRFTIGGVRATLHDAKVDEVAGDQTDRPNQPDQPDQPEGAAAEGDGQALTFAWSQADRRAPVAYASGRETAELSSVWRSGPSVWQLPSDEARRTHTAVYHFDAPVEISPDQTLQIEIDSSDVGQVRLSVTPIGQAIAGWDAGDSQLLDAAAETPGNRTEAQNARLVSAFHRSTVPLEKQSETSQKFRARIVQLRCGKAMTMVAQAIPKEKIPVSRVLPRGDWQDKTGALAPPGFPEFLPGLISSDSADDENADQRRTRLELAQWLTSPENPLTARHFVNRTWKQFFGTGLSGVIDDLGNQGEWPSHPRLLDWLASEFIESGWDVKHLVRLIVTSETYRQAAAVRDDLNEIDPYNRLLSQQSPRRLEAEAIRDNALSIANLLVTDYAGGPSVFPYQPAGHYRQIQFPPRVYNASDDWRQYRRGVYMHWQRAFLHPMLVNFDAPSRDECAADRPLSNSPQQALTLLNDPTFVEASNHLAANLIAECGCDDFSKFLDAAYLKALARKPSQEELSGQQKLFTRQLAYFQRHPEEAKRLMSVGRVDISDIDLPKLAAYAQTCRVILNLHETITRY